MDNDMSEPDAQSATEEGKQRRPRFGGRRWEWMVLGLICLSCLVYWAFHYQRFYVPHADYPSFERLSREIWRGEMPSSYQRMPLFPALMGGVARLIPHERPEHEAALLLNMAFSVGVLIMLYLFLRPMLGSAALIAVAMMGVSQLFHEMALLPLVEPLMGFLILLTLFLIQKRSRWQYIAAFFAALTRIEAAGLIPTLFVLNAFSLDWRFYFSKARGKWAALFNLQWDKRVLVKNLIFAFLASLGAATWMAMNFFLHAGDEFYSTIMGYTDPNFGIVLRSAYEPFHGWILNMSKAPLYLLGFSLAAILPCLSGFIVSFRRRMRGSFAVIIFTAIYLSIQVAFGLGHTRYVYPIVWVSLMYFVIGWSTILPALTGWLARLGERNAVKIGITIFMSALAAGIAFFCLRDVYLSDGVAWQGIYPIFLGSLAAVIGLYAWFAVPNSREAAVSLGCLLAILILTIGCGSISNHAEKTWGRKYRNYSHYVSGIWLRDNLREGEKAVLLSPGTATESVEAPRGELISFRSFKAQNMGELISELEQHGVTYVIYNYRDAPDEDERSHLWYYYYNLRVDLCNMFEGVKDIPGFEHVATLELGDYLKYYDEPKPQVYRFIVPSQSSQDD